MDVGTRGEVDDASMPYLDQVPRSPWIVQLAPDGPPRPLGRDLATDVAIVGAGIAGVATAFFTLRNTSNRVVLLERDRVARGATGRNAGQLTTYFERPLASIAAEFGLEAAVAAQQAVDEAHDLLDQMAAESGATVRVERFTGHMGMFSLDQVLLHLQNNAVRLAGGIAPESCLVSEQAPFLDEIPADLRELFDVVPQARIRALLETDDDRYVAVLSDRKGCANSGLLVQQVLAHLEDRYAGRLVYHDTTLVDRIALRPNGVGLHTPGGTVTAGRVVLCTNGFTDHVVQDESGTPVELHPDQRVTGTIGFMAAFVEEQPRQPAAFSFIRNQTVGTGETPYVYVTRRTYDRAEGTVTLTCMGGPEFPIPEPWREDLPFPGAMLGSMDELVRPFAQPRRPRGRPYDFQWHGLMGYMDGMIRVIGAHPRHPALMYNLGCNGVGFLPSIRGGERIARLLAGERLAASIFDPRERAGS